MQQVSDRASHRPLQIGLVSGPMVAIPPPGYAGTERIVAVLVTELARRRALDDRIRRRQATREEMERERQWHLARVRYLERHIRRLRQRPV